MGTNSIAVQDLTKTYGKIRAVDGVTFTVRAGEIFGFLGPNGAGKSTTIKMLTTLLKPTSGKIVLNGYNVATDSASVRKSFGIIFQDPSLDDDLTAYENMEFHGVLYNVSKKVRQERIQHLMTVTELWERKDDLVKHFSGGMKRRLEIARGLLHHPKVLFLDEPTIGLDPQTRNHIWDYILDLNKKEEITVFFTTHYMEEAGKVADRIAIIDRGKIRAQGTVKELEKKTKTKTLEAAFIKLTGRAIREEEASGVDQLRMHRRMWSGRQR